MSIEDIANLTPILELFVEESQLNVHAGELEVRPPGAPTTQALFDGSNGAWRLVNTPMRAPVVKSPEIFLLAKHTFIDAAEADPSSRPGPA